ncbi:MAG: FecR family protein [Methylobacter sp.]|nr:FecR family protein [Methylobacter sp.]
MKSPEHSSDALRDEAVDWLLRLHSKTCTESERRAFHAWLAESQNHRQAYAEMQAHWAWMEPFKKIPFPARDAALHHRCKSRYGLFLYGIAASLLLALGLTAFSPNGWVGVFQTYSTEKGHYQTLALADGSSLELNTDTVARVHFNHWRRSVELVQGEAFFTVAHEAERSFEVQAGKARIRDIGTAFDVYMKPEQVIIAVREGIVEVQAVDKRELTAGQQLGINSNGEFQPLQNQDIAGLTPWREGQLVFRNRRLDDVLAELSRYHDTRIRLQAQALGKSRISGTFHTAKLDEILNAVATVLLVKISHLASHEIVLEAATSPDR